MNERGWKRFIEEVLEFERSRALEFTFKLNQYTVKGTNMTLTIPMGNPVPGTISTKNGATLATPNYTSSDPTIFTVAPDPSNPDGLIVTPVGAGTATLTATAVATETGGFTEDLSDPLTVVVTPPADSLILTFPGFTLT